MARYTGPKCRLCRREGVKLYLKGARCLTDKCGVTRRTYAPGDHGKGGRSFGSDFSKQLREKQKAKKIYGVLEAQFRKYFEKASRVRGVTGQLLLQMLESRLDSVMFSSGMALSRAHARKVIEQGKVKVNGKAITKPSYQIKAGDVVSFDKVESTPKPENEMPEWIMWDAKVKGVKMNNVPSREQIQSDINEQLIVEYYSR